VYCYKQYPHHDVSDLEFWYYDIELGFYLALIVSQFFDVKRKDFWQMFIHHLVTVSLLVFSWASNLVRVGSLVLIIHDFADIPLEGAKLARYTKSETAGNFIFAVFTFCWIYSRMGLLPSRVLAYSLHWALDEVPMFPAYYIFNALLVCLQILHIVWTWLILRIAYNAIYSDGVKDLRESDESQADEGDETTATTDDEGDQANEEEEEAGDDIKRQGGGDTLLQSREDESGGQVKKRPVAASLSSASTNSNGNNNQRS
jgi:ceramide synthetase